MSVPSLPPAVAATLAAALAALAERGGRAEPPEAAIAAEACRLAWRPARVRVLLLAESHVATAAAELSARVALPPGVDWPGPAGFVRHLYCAGYGEPALVTPAVAANAGSPQFWRLMAAAEAEAEPARPALLRAAPGGPGARLAAKAALLHRLRARGIWLTDAALVALAAPGVRRVQGAARDAWVLRESWHRHHRHHLPALAPARVVVIGLGVARALAPALDAAFPGRWEAVAQPNGARAPGAAAALRAALAAACARHAPA